MKVNLHKLINQPGAGKAEKELRKKGYWELTPLEILYSGQVYQLQHKRGMVIQQTINAIENMEYQECN